MPPEPATPVDLPKTVVTAPLPPLPGLAPVRAHRIHWLLSPAAAIVALVLPRRMGPHLAASSWAAAYLVHLLSMIVFLGVIFATSFQASQSFYREPATDSARALSLSEQVRLPLAAFVLIAYAATASWARTLVILLVFFILEAAVWAGASALVVMYIAGEPRARAYLRGVKLLLWSTAALLPLACAFNYMIAQHARHEEETVFATFFTWLLWWVSIVLRLGARYGGPSIGPGWEPRALHCETCNYELTTLPLAGRCPECGHAVAESLRELRHLPRFARAGFGRRFLEYWPTLWRSLFASRFARHVCVHQGQDAARRFAWMTCLVIGVLVALAVGVSESVDAGNLLRYVAEDELFLPLLILCWFGALGALAAMALVLAAGLVVTRLGFAASVRRSIVLCYASGWLILPTTLTIGGVWATVLIYRDLGGVNINVNLPVLGPVERGLIIGAILTLPALTSFGLWLLHLWRMLRCSRYANA